MTIDQINNLATPALLLDKKKLLKNLQKMSRKAKANDVNLRTHLKTAKCAEVAKILKGLGHDAITVSTLKEAEYFASEGFNDVLYAVCIEPGKFARAQQLMKQGVDLKVILDSVAVANGLAVWAAKNHCMFKCLIEIDCDGHRAGVTPDSQELLEIAEVLNSSDAIEFAGIMTHGGGAYDCDSWSAVQKHAELEREQPLLAANNLRESGFYCEVISIGSTPTVVAAEHFTDITEIRPGVYVFQDLFQAGLGVCQLEDIAVSVLTSVTSHSVKQGKIFIDAGALALSKDRSTAGQTIDYGYGLVCNQNGEPLGNDLRVTGVNQEHGVIEVGDDELFAQLPIGSRLRILPNHVCMTAAAYDQYFVIDDGVKPEIWPRCNRW